MLNIVIEMYVVSDCDEPTDVPNSVARTPSGSQVGDYAVYECNSGYGLVGVAEVICEPSGLWGTVPECRLGKTHFTFILNIL